jgi:hypothetical protein
VPVVRLAVAACVLLVLTACGMPRPVSETAQQALPAPTPSAAPERADYLARGGIARSLREDVTLLVSTPTSFTPTKEAYPKAVRAVAFELVIDNHSDAVYRATQLSFVATVDGVEADQVIDSTQGYSGVTGVTDEVLPRQTTRFSVAFGVPAGPCSIRVAVRPEMAATSTIPLFNGTV